jgi:hypothetical protein
VAENGNLNEITSNDLLVRCAWCKRIKRGATWVAEVEAMRLTPADAIERHSHGICPDCFAELTPPGHP